MSKIAESLENGWILLCCPISTLGALEFVESLANSLESLEMDLFEKAHFPKEHLFRSRRLQRF